NTDAVNNLGTLIWPVDTIVEVTTGTFTAKLGSAAAYHWRDIEYPGLYEPGSPDPVFNLDCDELSDQVEGINEAEAIPRIVAVAPHSYPWVASIVYPKRIYFAENRGCGDSDILYVVHNVGELAKIIIGPIVFGDEDTPHKGPDGTGPDDITIYSEEIFNDRVIDRNNILNI